MVSAPTKTLASVRRSSASKVLLTSREIVDKHEAGLDGVEGAQDLISIMKARRSVSKLILGHNSLGDAGCRELFQFLGSDPGKKYKISEITLGANGIRNEGLEALVAYLTGNRYLRAVYLQNNKILGNKEIALKLSHAINSSALETLSLNTNNLGDTFTITLLRHLDSSTLRELQISTIDITNVSAQELVCFLTSERSQPLEVLKCNGNGIALDTLRTLYSALQKNNFTLRTFEVHGMTWSGVEALIAEESAKMYHSTMEDLRKVTLRNELLRNRLHEQALLLLRYSRTLLLPSSRTRNDSRETLVNDTSKSRFLALPSELHEFILSFLAPVLSTAQRTRVIAYASNVSTLRPVLPRLGSASEGCVPDPATLPFGMDMGGPGIGLGVGFGPPKMTPWVTSPRPNASRPPRLCDSGKCMGAGGSVFCHRNEARIQWLAEVGCKRFEAAGRTADAVLQLLA